MMMTQPLDWTTKLMSRRSQKGAAVGPADAMGP